MKRAFRYFFGFAILSVSTAMAATPHGHWEGTGIVAMAVNGEFQGAAPCQVLRFDVERGEKTFALSQGYFHCGEQLNWEYDPFTLAVNEGRLITREEQEIGFISDKRLHIEFKRGEEIHRWVVKCTEDTALYTHTYQQGPIIMTISGALQKK